MTIPTVDLKISDEAIHESLEGPEAQPLIITKDGKPFAALVPLPETDLETATLSLDPGFLAIIERSRRRLEEEGGIPLEEMERRFREEPPGSKP